MSGNRNNWSRNETILAMDLYCRIPFGSIGKDNPLIIDLAHLIGRTPSAVGLKLSNIAHCDPYHQTRGVSGMAHGSKLDKEIFDEFNGNISELAYEAMLIKKSLTVAPETIDFTYNAEETMILEQLPPGEQREAFVKQRVGQYMFRLAILTSYSNMCCITGLKEKDLLIASHIKPWSVSDIQTERTNPRNGLCLNALHDRAFDKGLITIDKNYKIIVSKRLKDAVMDENTYSWFMKYDHEKIALPDKFIPGKEFIEYHNDVIFIK